jgi:hypothetical protein
MPLARARFLVHQRIAIGSPSGLVGTQLFVFLERVELRILLKRLPWLRLRRRIGRFGLDDRRRGGRLIAAQLLASELLAGRLLPRHLRAAANRSERLTFGAFDLGRVRAAAAFEVEMLADGVVK